MKRSSRKVVLSPRTSPRKSSKYPCRGHLRQALRVELNPGIPISWERTPRQGIERSELEGKGCYNKPVIGAALMHVECMQMCMLVVECMDSVLT